MVILLMTEPGSPQNVKVSKIGAHEITLQWDHPAQSKGILAYEVYQVSIRRIHNIIIWQGCLEVILSILISSFLVKIVAHRLFPWKRS